ncbi:MAG TPA: ABC transporter ATP-binding protein [Cellvibrionaceae bacterium]
MNSIISVNQLGKTYKGGFTALDNIQLDIVRGEIFALLGPNGAGKTTLISIICGIVNASNGTVTVDNLDSIRHFREVRKRIGLVPQELAVSMFESVWDTVRFSRGLFGKAADDDYLEQLLKSLSLWDKKDARIMALSGGMKRRVLIAKALAHQPEILFLDEPTAGVDVELRRDMWGMIRRLREQGVTIILTTHYIEEAENMADRIGVINKGRIILVENKQALMQQLGQKQLTLHLTQPLSTLPTMLATEGITLAENGKSLTYSYSTAASDGDISALLARISEAGIHYSDLVTRQSSLEDIFVNLVEEHA